MSRVLILGAGASYGARPSLEVSKRPPRNEPSIEMHRRACLEVLRQEPILPTTIIGLRPPHREGNDDFLKELFELIRNRSAPKLYVSPSSEECAVAKTFGLEVLQGGLEEYLQRNAGLSDSQTDSGATA